MYLSVYQFISPKVKRLVIDTSISETSTLFFFPPYLLLIYNQHNSIFFTWKKEAGSRGDCKSWGRLGSLELGMTIPDRL
jgi:hypothetical protein